MLTTHKHMAETAEHQNANRSMHQATAEPGLQLIEPVLEFHEDSNPAHPGISGDMGGTDDPFFRDGGSKIENTELYQSYVLIQNVLYHSFMEIKRRSTQAAEVEFWKSRRADFFVYLTNLHRECMEMDPIHADTYRKGIARTLDKPSDWLMPEDDLTEDEVEAYCEDYLSRWRQLSEAHPEGVEDPEIDKMFEPNIDKSAKPKRKVTRKAREPVPINEYRHRRQQSKADDSDDGGTRTESQLEFVLDTGGTPGQPEKSASQSHPRPAEKVTPQEVFGPSLTASTASMKVDQPPASSSPGIGDQPNRHDTTDEMAGATAFEDATAGGDPPPGPETTHTAFRDRHPMLRRAAPEDPRKHPTRPRFRTQWVTSG